MLHSSTEHSKLRQCQWHTFLNLDKDVEILRSNFDVCNNHDKYDSLTCNRNSLLKKERKKAYILNVPVLTMNALAEKDGLTDKNKGYCN